MSSDPVIGNNAKLEDSFWHTQFDSYTNRGFTFGRDGQPTKDFYGTWGQDPHKQKGYDPAKPIVYAPAPMALVSAPGPPEPPKSTVDSSKYRPDFRWQLHYEEQGKYVMAGHVPLGDANAVDPVFYGVYGYHVGPHPILARCGEVNTASGQDRAIGCPDVIGNWSSAPVDDPRGAPTQNKTPSGWVQDNYPRGQSDSGGGGISTALIVAGVAVGLALLL